MAALTNTTTTADMNFALDTEFKQNYMHDADRLIELLGNFNVETMQAGQALQQVKITGTLNTAAYTEGDEVGLSKYAVEKTPVGTVDIAPYRKLTTAAAIAKSGYEVACLRTDKKMASDVRANVINKFFTFLANGTGTATGTNLQKTLANIEATIGNAMETNMDEMGDVVYFVNRADAYAYLGEANITTQNVFGLTYLKDFLGVQNVFLTNKVASKTVYATPADNIRIYGIDFGALANAGLEYATDESGLIGVAHTPAYDRVSVETNVINGMLLFPEIKDYIVKGTIATTA